MSVPALGAALATALLGMHLLPAPVPAARRPETGSVTVLVSGTTDAAREAVRGLRARLDQRGVRGVRELQLAAGGAAPATLREGEANVVVAVGPGAAEAALRVRGEASVVSLLALEPPSVGTGVLLDFPAEQQVQLLRRLLPASVRRIGIIYSPAQNERTVRRLRELARAQQLEIVARPVAAPAEIPAALASLTSGADVLWGIPDDVVMTTETARSILLFSMRQRLPLIGLSGAWVRAGALLALDRDYADMGAQGADLAWRLLNGEPVSAVHPEAPRRVLHAINLRTADQMGLRLPAETIRTAAEVIR